MADAATANEERDRTLCRVRGCDHYVGRPGDICYDCANGRGVTLGIQEFFADFAKQTRKPHYGEMQAGWVRALLTRATEEGLYDPSKENA